MSELDIVAISRSWIGHLATDPRLRDRLDELGDDDAAIAKLINESLQPKADVQPHQVESIRNIASYAFDASAIHEEDDVTTFNRFGPEPPPGTFI